MTTGKSLVDDDEFRDKVKRKCLNDWNIELNEDQVTMGIIEMEQQKLSIFHRQLWPNKRGYKIKKKGQKDGWGERITWDKTVDGYRAIALRNGLAGIDGTKFVESDNKLVMATVTVYRLVDGNRYPFTGEAHFKEFVQTYDDGNPMGQWKSSPRNQLSIAAQKQALRIGFQECEDDEYEYQTIAADNSSEPPETDHEPTRGESIPQEDPPPIASGSPSAKPAGKYVGLPKEGYKYGQMYNDDERIVVLQKMDNGWTLALDSGKAAVVDDKGYETAYRDRNDGGKVWSQGDTYYDGAKVEKIAESKKGTPGKWLALDSGFKVKVDDWGKELKRKERKKKAAPETKEEPKKEETKKEDPKKEGTKKEDPKKEDPKGEDSKENGKSEKGLEELQSKTEVLEAVAKMTEAGEVRKAIVPLLKEYCMEANEGVKLSYKAAMEKFTGVMPSEQMGTQELKALFECLIDALEAHKQGKEYPEMPENPIA